MVPQQRPSLSQKPGYRRSGRPLDKAAFEDFARSYDGPERLAAGEREFYVDFCEGAARSKLDPAMKKAKVIKCRATARNLRSLQRMLEKMD